MKAEETSRSTSSDPRHHAGKIKGSLDDLIQHLREDIGKVQEPKAQALFETAAEVLVGLRTAFDHYEHKAEPAMTESTPAGQSAQRSPRQENL
jgi:hypothetical protein